MIDFHLESQPYDLWESVPEAMGLVEVCLQDDPLLEHEILCHILPYWGYGNFCFMWCFAVDCSDSSIGNQETF